MASALPFAQNGNINPKSVEIPMIARFLVECMSMYWRLDITSPINIPKPII